MEIQTIKISAEERHLLSGFIGEDIGDELDFNRLMPVVEKIESLKGVQTFGFTIGQHDWACVSYRFGIENSKELVSVNSGTSKIAATYKAVIEFIKWYNNQKET